VLVPGLTLRADVDPARLPPAPSPEPGPAPPPRVLYEDEVLLAVDKPAGRATVPTANPAEPSLFSGVQAWLGSRRGGPAYLAVHQRLDRDTTGVVLFGTDPAANAGLAGAFDEGRATKTYDALTARPDPLPAMNWTVDAPVGRTGRGRVGVRPDGDPARTDFERRAVYRDALWVRAWPRTGRTHQVRVHLAHSGAPLLGDRAYAPPATARRAARVMLHAAVLELPHPITGAALRIASPWPADFQALMAELGRVERPRSRTPRR
jgi:RluA family pseudouridine synthase